MTHPTVPERHLWPVEGPAVDTPAGPDRPDPIQSATGARHLLLTRASDIAPLPTFWMWEARIPQGALTIGPGREGIGKSLFCSWLAARVTLGELPGVHYGTPKSVIYAATEDSWERTLAGRLIVAGADMDRVYRVGVTNAIGAAVTLALPTDCDAMGEAIRAHDVGLLVVDPLISALDGKINPNQDRELRSALEPLVTLADDTGCAVFGLAHFNKSSGTDPLSRIMGGRAFSAVARAAIAFARDTQTDDGSCVISQVKNNLGTTDVPSLRYVVDSVTLDTVQGPAEWGRLTITGETDTHVKDLLDDIPAPAEDRADSGEAAAWLKDFLTDHDGVAEVGNIFAQGKAAGGWSEPQLRRAKKKLGIPRPTKDGMKGGWTWRLPTPGGTEDDEGDDS